MIDASDLGENNDENLGCGFGGKFVRFEENWCWIDYESRFPKDSFKLV